MRDEIFWNTHLKYSTIVKLLFLARFFLQSILPAIRRQSKTVFSELILFIHFWNAWKDIIIDYYALCIFIADSSSCNQL